MKKTQYQFSFVHFVVDDPVQFLSNNIIKKLHISASFQNLQIIFFFQKLSQFKSNMPSVHHYYQLFKVKKGLHKLKPVCDYLNLKSCSLGNCNSDIEVLSSSILSLEPLVTPNLLAIRAPQILQAIKTSTKFPSKMRNNWKNREKISLINYATKFQSEEKWCYDFS